jgi:hypothetical protein
MIISQPGRKANRCNLSQDTIPNSVLGTEDNKEHSRFPSRSSSNRFLDNKNIIVFVDLQ